MQSYIQVLIQSLHQKVEALDCIIEKNKEQYHILSVEEADMEAFDANVREKSEYIDKIVFLDDGFEEIYSRVKAELDENRAAHIEEIRQMKKLISDITERSMKIQAQEQRNKELAGMQFAKAKKKVRQVKAGNKVAMHYYQNMQQLRNVDPQFMDKKK
ncbi:MAG: flagellar protein FlgN [Lachnospiraceae bacterium]|nr:flagellar protein FlgN [Lachnospiraceae bacterium]